MVSCIDSSFKLFRPIHELHERSTFFIADLNVIVHDELTMEIHG